MSASLALRNREGSEVESAYLSPPVSLHLDALSLGFINILTYCRLFYCQGDFNLTTNEIFSKCRIYCTGHLRTLISHVFMNCYLWEN